VLLSHGLDLDAIDSTYSLLLRSYRCKLLTADGLQACRAACTIGASTGFWSTGFWCFEAICHILCNLPRFLVLLRLW
jgi:hypothetical protein